MTESVIEALDNKALGMREAKIPDVSLRGTSPQTGDVAIRTPGGQEEKERIATASVRTGFAMTGTEAARVVEDADPYDAPVGDGLRTSRDGVTHHGPSGTPAPTEKTGDAAREMDTTILNHLRALHAQAEELKRDFPDFDLDAALHDPAFLRLTAPALGVGVREAFYALNRPRLDALAAARAAEESKALLARAVSGGAQRPREGGGNGAAALLRSDYAALPRDRQLALKQRIREAAARGEKMYP